MDRDMTDTEWQQEEGNPTCDDCGITADEAGNDWCGNCGMCDEHCNGYVGCDNEGSQEEADELLEELR